MNGCSGKVNINGTQAIIALQTTSLHNVVAFRIGRTKMTLEMNIVHKSNLLSAVYASSVCAAPSFLFLNLFFVVSYINIDYIIPYARSIMIKTELLSVSERISGDLPERS